MDEQKVIDALDLADKICTEQQLITPSTKQKDDHRNVISLAVGIMIADAIKESTPKIENLITIDTELLRALVRHLNANLNMGIKEGDSMAEFTHDFEREGKC